MKYIYIILFAGIFFHLACGMISEMTPEEDADSLTNLLLESRTIYQAAAAELQKILSGDGPSAHNQSNIKQIGLSGTTSSKEITIPASFTCIILNSAIDTKIIKANRSGATSRISIIGDSALLDRFKTTFNGDELIIGLKRCHFQGKSKITAVIVAPEIRQVTLNKGATAMIQGNFNDLTVRTLDASQAILKGSARSAVFEARDTSYIHANNLRVQQVSTQKDMNAQLLVRTTNE